MKKVLVFLLAMLLSVGVFAFDGAKNQGFEKNRNRMEKKGSNPMRQNNEYLIGKIKINDLKTVGVSQANIDIIVEKVNEFKDYRKRNDLDEKEKELKIERLMLDKNKDWIIIEKYLKELGLLRAEAKLKILKSKDELKQYITDAQYEEALELARQRRNKFGNQKQVKKQKQIKNQKK